MRNAIRVLSLLLSLLMVVTCFAGVTFVVAEDAAPAAGDGTSDPANVALGAKVSATSNYIPPEGFFHPDFLTDGQWGTFNAIGDKLGWNSDTTSNPLIGENDPVDVTIELDATYTLSKAVLKPMQWTNGGNFPRDFELQVSVDGENWVKVGGETDCDASAASNTEVQPRDYAIDDVDARYFRIHITRHRAVDAGGAYFSSIGEVELYGVPASYVKDGLVALFDGKTGESGSDKWVDSVSGITLPVVVNDKNGFNGEGYRSNGKKNYFPQEIVDLINGEEFTVELLFADFVSIGSDFNTFLNSDNDNFALFRRCSSNVLEFKFYGCPGGERWTVPDCLNLLQNSLVTVTFKAGGVTECYVNGEKMAEKPATKTMGANNLFIGHEGSKQYDTTYKSIRFYNRVLTEDEIAANAAVDGYVYIPPVDPLMEQTTPTFVIDFSEYSEDAAADYGYQNANGMEYSTLLNSGYATFKDVSGDPYVWIMGDRAKGLYDLDCKYVQYIVIKYRSFGGAQAEFFVQRSDGVNPGQPGSHVGFGLNGDGEWHTAVIDASTEWGNAKAKLTIFRLDPLAGANGCEIDYAYVAFFSTKEAAEAWAGAETETVSCKGELNEGDAGVFAINGSFWTADKWFELVPDGNEGLGDGQGNAVTLNGARVIDADGHDTMLKAYTLDDGRQVAAGHLIPLTYQSPLDGAVTVGDKQYVYTQKVAVSAVYDPVMPEGCETLTNLPEAAGGSSSDTFYINNHIVINNGHAYDWIKENPAQLVSMDGSIASVAYGGWFGSPDEGAIEAYGYTVNGGEPVLDSGFVRACEDAVRAAAGTDDATRYSITVDLTGFGVGTYNVQPVVKFANGNVCVLPLWGVTKIVVAADKTLVGYTDGTESYPVDSVIYTEGEQQFVLIGAVDVTDGAPEGLLGKYVYDTAISFVTAPAIPVNPAECQPVYLLDGPGLNTDGPSKIEDAEYDFAKGCVRYTSTGGDPNAGAHQIPAGTVVGEWMVLKYRTETGGRGEIFLGSNANAIGESNVPFPGEYIADGEWHTFVVNVGRSQNYDHETNVINHFRNDCLQGEGQWVEIEYYAFFDTQDKAEYYASHDLHVLPQPPKSFTATFVADGEVIGTVEFQEGAKTLTGLPKVPAKEGFTGKWEKYTLADADITINAVYTPKEGYETEPETEPATEPTDVTEPATEPTVTEPATEPAVVTEPATEADATEADTAAGDEFETTASEGGCKSVAAASGVVMLLAVIGMAVIRKKKED